MMRKSVFKFAAFLAFSGWADAMDIEWYSLGGVVNLDSVGVAMDAGFVFELGVFSAGFIPSESNVVDWGDHWNMADTAAYVPAQQLFTESHVVTGNPAPFTVGAQAWILGRRVSATGTEMILFRRDSWLWPAPNELEPTPLFWVVNGGTGMQVVLGAVNTDGSPFLMQSAMVRDYAQWRELKLAGEPLDGPTDDADSDGVSNAEEFVFDTNPLQPGAPPVTALSNVEINDEQYLRVSIPRNRAHLAHLKVQVSSDLATWNDGPAFTETLADHPTEWVVRDKTPFSETGGRRFMRLQLEIPE